MNSISLFGLGVAAFSVYNTKVILWEMNKEGSRVCPKCAKTRIVAGLALGAMGLVVMVQKWGKE